MQKHKLDFLIALTLALSAFILGALNLHDGQTWSGEDGGNGDFAQYLLQAIALNEGRISEFIEKSAFMTLNSYDGMGPIIYPWGYPLLLSLGIKVFGLHILSLKYINLIFFACFVGGFYIFCKNTMERKLAIYGALLFVCSPYFVHFHNRLLSDVPFMCVGFLGAILLQKYFMPPPPQGAFKPALLKQIIAALSLGAVFIVAFLIRSNGILLPLSFCAILLSLYISKLLAHRFYKLPLLQPPLWAQVLPMVVFICGYSLMNVYLPNGGAGHPSMGLETLSVKSILGNVFYYGNIFQDFFPLLASVALALSAPFCCYGIYQNFYKHFGIMVFCASVFALNVIWPFTQGLRFVFVLLPFCVYYTLLGFHALLGKRETTSEATCDSKGFMPEEFTKESLLANKDSSLQSTIRQICKISFILTLCIFIYYDLKEIIPNVRAKAQFPQDVYSKEALEMYHIIKEHTREDDIIAFFQPKILYLMTDRLALYQHQSCLEIESCALAFMQNVQYMLIREEEKYIYLLYQKHLHKVAQNATLGLYRVNFSYNATP